MIDAILKGEMTGLEAIGVIALIADEAKRKTKGIKMEFTNEQKLDALQEMDSAISNYIHVCTGEDPSNVDYSYINQDVNDAIEMLGGTPAEED